MLNKKKWKLGFKEIRLVLALALITFFSLYYTEGKALSQEIIYDATLVEDGIAYGELVYGAVNAPIIVIEYASLTCPHCATFHKDIFSRLRPEYIDTGKIKFIMRNIMSSHFDIAAVMQVRCTGPQKAWDVMDKMFTTQHDWIHDDVFKNLRGLMAEFGVDNEAFDSCFKRTDLQKSLVEIMTGPAQQDDVRATPTIFVNGKKYTANRTFEDFKTLFDALLESK